jgi:hypothetical protein
MRPIIPITVPTMSAVLKLLPFDEFEEPVAVFEDEELEVGDFEAMKEEAEVVWIPAPEGEIVEVVLAGVGNGDGDVESDVVVGDVSEVSVCCSMPKQPERRRINAVLTIPQCGAKIAPKRQRHNLSDLLLIILASRR